MVMSDKNTYYVWDEIEEIRQEMLKDTRELEFVDYGSGGPLPTSPSKGRSANMRRVCDIAKGSLARRKEAQLLARLVGWLGRPLLTFPSRGGIGDEASKDRKGLTIVELGTSLGVTTAYLAAMDSRNKVVTYEGCPAVAEVARANWEKLGLSNIACVVGEITVDSLQLAVDGWRGIDVAFIDANHTYTSTCKYFDVLAGKVHEKSVIVVDDIHHSKEMEQAWKAICADARVTSTIDLYQMGLVFFDKHYWRRNYKMRL
jgi:precorrin-6B methylase 2